jgi:hypothetical protein
MMQVKEPKARDWRGTRSSFIIRGIMGGRPDVVCPSAGRNTDPFGRATDRG